MIADRVIVHQYDPDRDVQGGINTCIGDLIRFAPRAYRFAVVGVTAGTRELGQWHSVEIGGREIAFLPVARLRPDDQARRVPHSARLAVGLVRHRRDLRGMVVQTHRTDLGAAVRVLLAPEAHFQFIHTDTVAAISSGSDSAWRRAPWAYHRAEAVALKHASQVVAFSRSEAARLSRAGVPVEHSMTWFDPSIFRPPPTSAFVDAGPHLVWVGRLEMPKDPLLAIAAFARFHVEQPSASLSIIGDGTLRSECTRLVDELGLTGRIALHGSLDRVGVAEMMRTSAVLIMSSRFEGSPRALIEAMACGVPVAAVRAADPDELIGAGLTGAHAESRSPEALAVAITHALSCSRSACIARVAGLSAPVAVERLLKGSTA